MTTMSRKRFGRSGLIRALAVAGVSSLLLAGCGSGGGSTGETDAKGESVPAGASKEDFIAALADMDEMTITMQSLMAPTSAYSVGLDAYANALEEWSGGKIKAEVQYSAAIAKPGKEVDAINEQRMDVGTIIPAANPAIFPVAAEWLRADNFAVSDALQSFFAWNGMTIERGWKSPELVAEYEKAGLHLLLPFVLSDDTGLLCTEPRADLGSMRGAQVRAGSEMQVEQITALGMTPISLDFTEMFDGLQRGTVNCTMSTLITAKNGGLLPIAKQWVPDPEGDVSWSAGLAPLGIGLDRWNELPLAGRQLLHDRTDVYMTAVFETMLGELATAYAALDEAGGSVLTPEDDAVDALKGQADASLDKLGKSERVDGNAVASLAKELGDEWRKLVADAGYDTVPFDKFSDLYKAKGVDVQPAVDLFRSRLLDEYRPKG